MKAIPRATAFSVVAIVSALSVVASLTGATRAGAETPEERAYREARHAARVEHRIAGQTHNPNANRNKTTKAAANKAKAGAKENEKAAKSDPRGPFQSALDQVSLTSDEKDRIATIDAKTNADSKAAYNDRSLSPDQYQAKLAQIDADHRKAVEDILTTEQRSKVESILGEKKPVK